MALLKQLYAYLVQETAAIFGLFSVSELKLFSQFGFLFS